MRLPEYGWSAFPIVPMCRELVVGQALGLDHRTDHSLGHHSYGDRAEVLLLPAEVTTR